MLERYYIAKQPARPTDWELHLAHDLGLEPGVLSEAEYRRSDVLPRRTQAPRQTPSVLERIINGLGARVLQLVPSTRI